MIKATDNGGNTRFRVVLPKPGSRWGSMWGGPPGSRGSPWSAPCPYYCASVKFTSTCVITSTGSPLSSVGM